MTDDIVVKCPECQSPEITADGMSRSVYDQDAKGEWSLVESELPDDFICRDCGHEWSI